MAAKIVELGGKRWAILTERDYRRLEARARAGAEGGWPKLPEPDAHGEYPAVGYARVSLARKIIRRRRTAGLTQAELARQAGIRPETLNRIERGRRTPDVATIAKIECALEAAGVLAEPETH